MRWALRLAPLGRACPRRAGRGRCSSSPRAGARTTRPRRITPAVLIRHDRRAAASACSPAACKRCCSATSTPPPLACSRQAGFEVVAPRQGCCGALSAHAGRAEESRAIHRAPARQPSRAWTRSSSTHLAAARTSRIAALPALDVTEALARRGSWATLHPLELTVAYQDSCHLRHAQRLPAAWRPLLARIPGLARRRARRAGPLLRLGRHLQHRPAGGGTRARRPQGRTRARDRRRRRRQREPRLPRAGRAGARPGREATAGPAPGGAARRVDARGRRRPSCSRAHAADDTLAPLPSARDETGRHTAPASHPGRR